MCHKTPEKMEKSGNIIIVLAMCCAFTFERVSARKLKGNEVQIDYIQNEAADDVIGDDTCAQQMSRVYRDDVMTPYPPVLSGEWTSLRCEVRPGPEFVLRKYRFHDGSRFTFHQFYYDDSSCQNDLFVVVAEGSYNVFQPSWLLPGATHMEYELNHVTVMAYSDKMAAILAAKVNLTCPGYAGRAWYRDQRYDIFNYVEAYAGGDVEENTYLVSDLDCLDALSFSLHELQLLRVEMRMSHHHMEQRLLLGDIHTRPDQRRTYRPTGFQDPLILAEEVHGCPVCLDIRDSDEYSPPSLAHRRLPALRLTGSWFSETCETRPNGIFVTRHLSFSDDNRTWEGYYHHFLDGKCQRPQFTIHVKGKLALASPSRIIGGAYEVDFQVLRASIKPTDRGVVALLNQRALGAERCGTSDSWKLDQEDDVTATNGCPALGILLPHVEFEILKLETRHKVSKMFLGQRPTHGSLVSPYKRPTSFQPPLVRCSDNMKAVTPPYQFHAIIFHSAGGASATTSRSALCFALSILLSLVRLLMHNDRFGTFA